MRYVILLAPDHGGLKQYLTQTGIENPQVRELDPRAGMRCFEISDGDTKVGLIEEVLRLCSRTSYQP